MAIGYKLNQANLIHYNLRKMPFFRKKLFWGNINFSSSSYNYIFDIWRSVFNQKPR